MSADSTHLCLSGLSGSTLLGFMAALGTFKTLAATVEGKNLRMTWTSTGGSYAPMLIGPVVPDKEMLLRNLHTALAVLKGHYVITVDKDLKISAEAFRYLSCYAADNFLSGTDTLGAEMTAAFGCAAIVNEENQIEDTSFRTMSGAGHQHFLEFMDVLAKGTTIEHLREALFGPWRYRDPSPIMRWDNEDDRRYALRWDEPSKDPVRTVRGANRLAIAALPLFPVVPNGGNTIATTAFSGRGSRGTFVTWPIWDRPLSLDATRSLLSLQALQNRRTNSSKELESRGIRAVYRSQRITLGKYRNFTPAEAL